MGTFRNLHDVVSQTDPTDDQVSSEWADDVLKAVFGDSNFDADFLAGLQEYANIRHEEGDIAGTINMAKCSRQELAQCVVRCEAVYKKLKQLSDILESNRGYARARLGQMMREQFEKRIELVDPVTGEKQANITLESVYRPSFQNKDDMLELLRAIGQEGVIQPDVPWQTRDKIVEGLIDSLPSAAVDPTTQRPIVDKLAPGYFIYQPTMNSTILALRYTDGTFRTIASVFQTNTAKVSKLYG